MIEIDLQKFETSIREFMKEKQDENFAFPICDSWDFCNKKFAETNDRELLALHLTAFLANWGMYRGSAGLFRANFQVHLDAIDIILNEKYSGLRWRRTREDLGSNMIVPLNELFKALTAYYANVRVGYKNDPEEENKQVPRNITATETLITKILMVTTGATMAYDTFVKSALIEHKLKSTFSKDSLEQLIWISNESNLKDTIEKLSKELEYPKMKILDMYFWQYGLEMDKAKSYKKTQ